MFISVLISHLKIRETNTHKHTHTHTHTHARTHTTLPLESIWFFMIVYKSFGFSVGREKWARERDVQMQMEGKTWLGEEGRGMGAEDRPEADMTRHHRIDRSSINSPAGGQRGTCWTDDAADRQNKAFSNDKWASYINSSENWWWTKVTTQWV